MAISIFDKAFNMEFVPIKFNTLFVASALITNGNVNAEKLGKNSKFLYSMNLAKENMQNMHAILYKINTDSFEMFCAEFKYPTIKMLKIAVKIQIKGLFASGTCGYFKYL